MTQPPSEGLTLREYIDTRFDAHRDLHATHDSAHTREHDFTEKALNVAAELSKENKNDANEWRATMDDRERTFTTKNETQALTDKITDLQNAEIKRSENERNRLINDVEEKRQDERRQSRQQWIVGVSVTAAAVGINLLIRLLSENIK